MFSPSAFGQKIKIDQNERSRALTGPQLGCVSVLGQELVESGRREDLAAAEQVSLRRWSRYR
jgi:hypothetical protein